jgi:hypothetical protein
MKSNLGRQTRDLIALLRKHIRKHSVLPRRDLRRQIDILSQAHLALLQGAFEVAFLDGVAPVGVLVDQSDESVFDLEVHFETFADFLREGTAGFDGERGATVMEIGMSALTHGIWGLEDGRE